jgi:hypothetical protein
MTLEESIIPLSELARKLLSAGNLPSGFFSTRYFTFNEIKYKRFIEEQRAVA